MPTTAAFLPACRRRIEQSAEWGAFTAAAVLSDTSRAERRAQWGRLYSGVNGPSLAILLRNEIRGVVNAQADIAAATGLGVVSPDEREAAYAALVAEYAPAVPRPADDGETYAALQRAEKASVLQ